MVTLLVWQSPFPKRKNHLNSLLLSLYCYVLCQSVMIRVWCVVMSVNHGIILSGVGITSACSSSAASDLCTGAPAIWICSSCKS